MPLGHNPASATDHCDAEVRALPYAGKHEWRARDPIRGARIDMVDHLVMHGWRRRSDRRL